MMGVDGIDNPILPSAWTRDPGVTQRVKGEANKLLDLYKRGMADDADPDYDYDDAFIDGAIQLFEKMTGRDIGKEIVKENQ